MDINKKIDVAFLWHMHQPFYKDSQTGKYMMPWVRLHAVKDYYPMAALLENFPKIKMTFNLVPVLIEQLADYAENEATDTILDLTMKKASSLTLEDRVEILEHFFRVNFKRFIEPCPRYLDLLMKKGFEPVSGQALERLVRTFTDQDFLDLQVLFNLSWIHSINIEKDAYLRDLKNKRSFTEDDKSYVIFKHREIIAQILPLYRKLQENGQIEISTTPYYHPILPLLCDTSIARISMPNMKLPARRFAYPEDAAWHIESAIKCYTEQFGRPPRGMWPSEGSVSEEALEILMAKGIRWVATDEDILLNSLAMEDDKTKHHKRDRSLIYNTYNFHKGPKSITMVFRDKNLSDIISFNYNAWDPKDAALDLISHFRNIQDHMKKQAAHPPLITIIMDGENAWEYFEDNGRKFFETLYGTLSARDDIKTTTISGFLDEERPRKSIYKVFPGSWINHNFEIWIGQDQDNMSWEYLLRVREDLVKFAKESQRRYGFANPDIQRAWREFYIAEGSDWNWWYGGKLNSGGNNPFDKLYRTHLKNVYKILKKPIPDFLNISIA